jgi:glycosyltransferase involved in cell wall biosynthesis
MGRAGQSALGQAEGNRVGMTTSHLAPGEAQADPPDAVFEEITRGSGGKIAVITPYYHPRVGGLENYARHSVQTLRRAGFHVVVVTSAHEGHRRVVDEVDGVRVYRLPRLVRILNTPLHPLWPIWLRSLLTREGVSGVIAHTPVPGMADAARLARGRRPFVVTYHNDLVKSGRLGQLLCRLERHFLTGPTLAAADQIVVTSEHYSRHSSRLRQVQNKITISAPGVDTALFRKTQTARVPARLIFVGQLDRTHRHKGLDRLLDAVLAARQEVPALSLMVVGSGNDQQRYAARADEMGIGEAVSFVGFVPDETLRDLYRSSCALVLPAEHAAEGFGMVVLEAAACGVPAVATNVGGLPAAVLDGVTGLLVPPGDTVSLADALVRITRDAPLREHLAGQAYARVVRSFSWDVQGRAVVDLLKVYAERS